MLAVRTACRLTEPMIARLVAVLLCMALCSCRSTRLEVAPACAKPAPLEGKYDRRAPGYEIELNGTAQDFWSTVGRWEREYALRVDSKLYLFNMIQVTMTPDELARLRCDPAVKFIEHNSVVSIRAIARPSHGL
jgi:hypothetical protein